MEYLFCIRASPTVALYMSRVQKTATLPRVGQKPALQQPHYNPARGKKEPARWEKIHRARCIWCVRSSALDSQYLRANHQPPDLKVPNARAAARSSPPSPPATHLPRRRSNTCRWCVPASPQRVAASNGRARAAVVMDLTLPDHRHVRTTAAVSATFPLSADLQRAGNSRR